MAIIAPCFAIFLCAFNVYSMYIQCVFNIHSMSNNMPVIWLIQTYGQTDWLSYPKSRIAIASENTCDIQPPLRLSRGWSHC